MNRNMRLLAVATMAVTSLSAYQAFAAPAPHPIWDQTNPSGRTLPAFAARSLRCLGGRWVSRPLYLAP